VDSPAHRALALKQARQAIVLLQNEPAAGGRPLLPLAKGAKVAMIGAARISLGTGLVS
jgi:beta-glucosidase-like glycosyl hydrolase